MSHRSPEDLVQRFDELMEQHDERLAGLVNKYAALKALQADVNAEVGSANRALQEALTEQGLTSMRAGPVLVTLQTKRGIGVAEGESEETGLNNMQEAREWVDKYNPPQTSITQANLKKTFEAYLEAEGGDAPLPEFLRETEVEQLSLRRSSE